MAFELQGHRGARGLFPENTLEGFVAAVALGVDAIELDIGVTADGVPVVFHDVALHGDFGRVPRAGEATLLRSLTLAELAGGEGARVPTLQAVFAATAPVRICAELKTRPDRPEATVTAADMAERVLAVAAASGALGRLDVRSFDWRGLRHVRACQPGVQLTFLTSPATVAQAALWWAGPTPAEHGGSVARAVAAAAAEFAASWAPEHCRLTRAQVREAQSLGLRVLPWTVNDPADMARLIAWGVDGLCSDRPDLARRQMARAGLPLPLPPAGRSRERPTGGAGVSGEL